MSAPQLARHALPVPLQTNGVHDAVFGRHAAAPLHVFVVSVPPVHEEPGQSWLGSVPSIVEVHVPFVPGTPEIVAAHAWHAPLQGVSQQKPSTQKPLKHWSESVHATALLEAPFATHVPVLHQSVAAQSPSPEQLALHDVAPHEYGVHDVVVVARHAPLPLQTCPFSWVPDAHVRPGHSTSGSLPSAIEPQTPSPPTPFLSAEHAWHLPVQAVVQHTPSTQLPSTHSWPSEQAMPALFCAAHLPPELGQ